MSSKETAKVDPKVRERLLANRGIGRQYHYMSLTNYPHPIAKGIYDIVLEYDMDAYRSGKGLNIVGDSKLHYDMSILIARGLILRDMNMYMINFNELFEQELISSLYDKGWPALSVLDFYPDTSVVSDTAAYRKVEALLKRHYINEAVPLFLHFPVEYNSADKHHNYGDLISKNFLELVLEKNDTIIEES